MLNPAISCLHYAVTPAMTNRSTGYCTQQQCTPTPTRFPQGSSAMLQTTTYEPK